jgi:phosphotriesterase-related protein
MVEGEKKVLRAAGMAQIETGAAINIHPGPDEDCPLECVRILKEVGADIHRVCFSHMTRTFSPEADKARFRLAESGCCLVYDWFGREGLRPISLVSKKVLVNDITRISQIKELIEKGFLKQIMISHDVCFKVMLRAYGGSGFDWVPTITVSEMRQSGLTEEQIHTILIRNPARIMSFV